MVTSRARLAPGIASAFRGAMARSQTVETQLVCLEWSILAFRYIPLNLGQGYSGCFSGLHRMHS